MLQLATPEAEKAPLDDLVEGMSCTYFYRKKSLLVQDAYATQSVSLPVMDVHFASKTAHDRLQVKMKSHIGMVI